MPVITIKHCLNCGVTHEWIFDGADLQELRTIKKLTGMRAAEFAEAGDEGDADAIAALLYILHRRDKITVPFDDINLDLRDFAMEPTEDEKREMDELAARMKAAADQAQDPKAKTSGSGRKEKAA